jgi:hypothetical protein
MFDFQDLHPLLSWTEMMIQFVGEWTTVSSITETGQGVRATVI